MRAGLYFDYHLTEPIDRDLDDDDRVFVGIELLDIENENMVVTVERLWATETENKEDKDAILLISKDFSGTV